MVSSEANGESEEDGWADQGVQGAWRVGGDVLHDAGAGAWVEGVEAIWGVGEV